MFQVGHPGINKQDRPLRVGFGKGTRITQRLRQIVHDVVVRIRGMVQWIGTIVHRVMAVATERIIRLRQKSHPFKHQALFQREKLGKCSGALLCMRPHLGVWRKKPTKNIFQPVIGH